MQVKDRAERATFVTSILVTHVVGNMRRSSVTVEFAVTVVASMLTILVVVGRTVRLPVL